jgi:hypothetical protein
MAFHVTVIASKGADERGVIADSPFLPGDTVFLENRPLVAAPFTWTRDYFPMCDHCLRSMERPDAMLARLAGLPKDNIALKCLPAYREKVLASASNSDSFDPSNPLPVPCPHCPLEVYCSPSCRQLAWDQHHRFTCPHSSNPAPDTPYLALANLWKEFHPPPEATTPFLIVRMICDIRGKIEAEMTFEEAAAPYMDFKRAPATSEGESSLHRLFMNSPANDQSNGSSSSAPTTLQEIHAAVVRLVGHPSLPEQLLSYTAFLDLFGLVALNAQGIGTSSLDNYQLFLRSLGTPEAEADMGTIEACGEMIDEVSAPYLRAEGSGLYALHRFLNHSCQPNCEIRFEGDGKGFELAVVSKRPVGPGEELTIGYLDDEDCDDEDCGHDHDGGEWEDLGDGEADEEMDEGDEEERAGDERRRQLKKFYLFDCRCEVCVEELKAE